MPVLRIVLEPEELGLGIAYDGELIHLGDDAEIVITGLKEGMQSDGDNPARPSMAFAFKLPNGDLVIAETSWRLFATAYHAFLGKFGEADLPGMQIEFPDDPGRMVDVRSETCHHTDTQLESRSTNGSKSSTRWLKGSRLVTHGSKPTKIELSTTTP